MNRNHTHFKKLPIQLLKPLNNSKKASFNNHNFYFQKNNQKNSTMKKQTSI